MHKLCNIKSHPVWDVWIEIRCITKSLPQNTSHPVWDVWIEIPKEFPVTAAFTSHPVWDVWIEIWLTRLIKVGCRRRIPSGMCGLKYCIWQAAQKAFYVASRLGCVD